MIKKVVIFVSFCVTFTLFSQQKTINNYKYLVVSNKFDFLKSPDQYQTSSLTKFLLEKKGFTVFLSDENLPLELTKNRCLAVYANVLGKSSMIFTKTSIEIKDCYGEVLYISKVGKTKEKNYKRAYQGSIRKAYATMNTLKYRYDPIKSSELKTIADVHVLEKPDSTNKLVSKMQNVLYAQVIENGYQLVDKKPSLLFKILKTNLIDVYVIESKNGILYKKDDFWIAEYYRDAVLVREVYKIKF